MKVKDLIEQLHSFNPLADVSLTDSETIYISYISEGGATPQTTKAVFIEGCDFCQKCQFYDDEFCLVYDKNCEDVEECYQYEGADQ